MTNEPKRPPVPHVHTWDLVRRPAHVTKRGDRIDVYQQGDPPWWRCDFYVTPEETLILDESDNGHMGERVGERGPIVVAEVLGWTLTESESLALEKFTHEREPRRPLPEVTDRAKAAANPDVVSVLTDFLRAPVCSVPKRGVAYQPPLAGWREVATYHGHKFEMVESFGPWETTELLLLGFYVQVHARSGWGDDCRAYFTLRDAADYCGVNVTPGRGLGGWQRDRVLLAIDRHQYTGFKYTRKVDGGTESVDFSCLQWKWVRVDDDGGGRGYVTFSDPFARLLRSGALTHLAAPVFRSLTARNPMAALLWSYLYTRETHRYPYLVFPDGTERENPTIAEFLRLDHRKNKRAVVALLRQCCRDIEADFPGAKLDIVQPAGRRRQGVWHLVVDKWPERRSLSDGTTLFERRNDVVRVTEGRSLSDGTSGIVGDESPANAAVSDAADAAPCSVPVVIPVEEQSASFFDMYFKTHPKPVQPKATRKAWDAAIADGADPKSVVKAAELYAAFVAYEDTPPQFVKTSATFLEDEYWRAKLLELAPAPARDDGPPRCFQCGGAITSEELDPGDGPDVLVYDPRRGYRHVTCPGAA